MDAGPGLWARARSTLRPRLQAYAVAVLMVAFCMLLAWALGVLFPQTSRDLFVLFVIAVMISAWYGLGPGLVATVLSTLLSDYFLLPPTYSFGIAGAEDLLLLGVFALVAVAVSVLVAARRRAETSLRAVLDELEARVEKRTSDLVTAKATLEEEVIRFKRLQERFESLARLAQAVTASLELQEVLDSVVRAATDLVPGSSARIWVVEGERLHLRSESGTRGVPGSGRKTELAFGEGLAGHVVVTRQPLVVDDVLADPRTVNLAWMREEGYVSGVGLPLLVRDRLVGALFLFTRGRHRFSAGELDVLTSFGAQAAIAIENARLYAAAQEQLKETEALLSVSRALSSTLELEALLRHFLRRVAQATEADSVGVWLVNPATGELEPTAGYHVPPHLLEGLRRVRVDPRESAFHARGLTSRRVLVSTNVPEDPDISKALKAVAPHRTQLFGPIVARDEVIGAFIAVWWERTREFSERELALVEAMGSQAGIAVENARLFREHQRKLEELAATQDQLIRTEKLRALGEMASGVAHDFNNLLTSILGRTQLLLKRIEDPGLREWLRVIEQSSLDGAQTVRRIQEFTRVRRDQPYVPVDLNGVVRDALEVTQPRWREEPHSRGITIHAVTALTAVPAVAGDPTELREALTNLILNAVDAMPEGGTLSLGTACAGEHVLVTVSDTGVGMSPDIQRRAFDPFFTTKGPRGTGLGLSMTYGIVTRHGGEISVRSGEGKGTTFRLAFPASPPVPAEASKPPASPAPGGLRCLVVDDEPLVRAVLGDLLSQGGHEAVLVADGAEAIARCRAELFDVVLTDLAMPGVSGLQVARAVKDHDPTVPVFVITGWGVEYSPEELRGHGVDRVLSKPVKLDDVLAAVAACAPRKTRKEDLG